MTVSRAYNLYSIVHDSTVIPGCTRVAVANDDTVLAEPTGGEVYARFVALSGQNPTLQFDTVDIKTIWDACGLTGTRIQDLTNKLAVWMQALAEGGTRASGANHRKLTLNEGLLIPQRLTCTHGQHASVSYQATITYDGTNDPLVISDSQSLPTAVADVLRFGLGPVTLESATYTHVKSLEIDFGQTVTAESSDGDIWPTFASIDSILPIIRLRGIDPEWLKAAKIPLEGKQLSYANTQIYLRKRTRTGFVADGTAEHIKINAAGVARVTGPFDASGVAKGETSLEIQCEYDGTNAPIAINTASAIV